MNLKCLLVTNPVGGGGGAERNTLGKGGKERNGRPGFDCVIGSRPFESNEGLRRGDSVARLEFWGGASWNRGV